MRTEFIDKEKSDINKLLSDVHKNFGVYVDVPVADDLRSWLESKGVIICEQGFSDNIDAAITIFDFDGNQTVFIGLNSKLHYDEQLFALAHELYNYCTHTGAAYENEENERTEQIADRFAAELLLPSESLQSTINGIDLNHISDNRIWRIIANLQCN